MHDLDRTLRSQEAANEADFEAAIFGEGEGDFEEESYEISEEQEMDLAAELLAVTDDRELDQFLGRIARRVRGAVGPMLKKYLKPLAKRLIPIAGRAVGGFFGGPVGAALGSKVGSFATTLFEVDFESMDGEAQDMEVARSFVRFANAAASNAAAAGSAGDPTRAAKNAITRAARSYAPGLLRKNGEGAGSAASVTSRASSGRWIRRPGRIVLLGV
jgi:hypothetical protein